MTRSNILLSAMNVPVRPAPALQDTQSANSVCNAKIFLYFILSDIKEDNKRDKISVYNIYMNIVVCVVPAVYNNGVVPRLLLLFLHCGDNVDHAFPLGRDSDLWPAVEVEVPDHPCLLLL